MKTVNDLKRAARARSPMTTKGWATRALMTGSIALGTLATGCGADCESTVEAMCERACECGDCTLRFDDGVALDATDVSSCVSGLTTFYGSCGDDDDNDYDACSDALESATCQEDGAYTVLDGPDACRPPG